MRTIPFLAALLCASPLANAKSELELLQDRCAEMERQIRALETENSQLKSQSSVSTKTVVETSKPTPAPAAAPTPAPGKAPVSTSTYATVRAGDTLAKVAKRNGTSTAMLLKLNKLTNPSLIQPGQKLRLPDAAPVTMAKSSPSAPVNSQAPAPRSGGTHIVKSGETFYSIARRYGMSNEALQAANPQIKPERMRAGQTLVLGASKQAPAPATIGAKTKSTPVSSPATSKSKAPAVSKTTNREPAPAPAPTPATDNTQASASPKLRLVVIDEPIDFGAFATAHGTTTAKLNALNGHNLNPSQLLAKESAFYVPAQP